MPRAKIPPKLDDDGFEPIGGDQFQFNRIGDSLQGELVAKGHADFDGRTVGRYTVRGDEGNQNIFLGSVTLDRDMDEVSIGDYFRVTYMDDAKSRSGFSMKLFKVQVRRGSPAASG